MVKEVLIDVAPAGDLTHEDPWSTIEDSPYPARPKSVDLAKDALARFKSTLNPDDFKDLVHEYEAPLHRFFLARLRSLEAAEECTQQVFVCLLTRSGNYDGTQGSLKAYVYMVAQNKLNDYYRNRNRHMLINETDFGAQGDPDSSGIFVAIPDTSDTRGELSPTLKDDLEKLLTRLKPEHAHILRLWSKDVPYQEIADTLNIKMGTVKSRIHHAIARLRELVENEKSPEILAVIDAASLN